jgi:hypothetical protein
VSPAIATVDTDVEAVSVPNWSHHRRRPRRLHRQVCRKS